MPGGQIFISHQKLHKLKGVKNKLDTHLHRHTREYPLSEKGPQTGAGGP